MSYSTFSKSLGRKASTPEKALLNRQAKTLPVYSIKEVKSLVAVFLFWFGFFLLSIGNGQIQSKPCNS